MARLLISYYSRSGNTRKMAEKIRDGAASVEGIEVVLRKISETGIDDMRQADGLIFGSPTYFGVMAAEVKDLIDKSVKYFGKMVGKAGGAFTSSGGVGGGNETTIASILQAWLIHGMVVQGQQKGSHYGPVAVGAPDAAVEAECFAYGKMMAELTLRLSG